MVAGSVTAGRCRHFFAAAVGPYSGRFASPCRNPYSCSVETCPSHHRFADADVVDPIPSDLRRVLVHSAVAFSSASACEGTMVSGSVTETNALAREGSENVDHDHSSVAQTRRSIQNLVFRTLAHPRLKPRDQEGNHADGLNYPRAALSQTAHCGDDGLQFAHRAMDSHPSQT